MEFKYRAINNKPTTTTSPLSTVTSISERLPGANEALGMSNTFRVPPEMWRELEKEKIRREIITGEIVRRQELEEEVRREMMMEIRALAFPTERCLFTPFSFQDGLAPWSNPTMNTRPLNDIIDMSGRQLPETVAHAQIKLFSQIDKEKVIMLPKPNMDLHSAKRKAVEIAINDNEASASRLKKKSKEEWKWKCSLCEVIATSEMALNEHLLGKKHKAKEQAERTHMIGNNNSTKTSLSFQKNENCVKDNVTISFPTTLPGLDAKTMMKFPQPSITMEEEKAMVEPRILEEEEVESKIIGGAENKNGKETEEAEKTKALGNKNVTTLWCDVCQICTFSPVVMETHKKGKKHLRKMMKLSEQR